MALTKVLFLTVVLCLINLTPAKPWLNEVEVAEREQNQALSAKDEELTGKIIRNFFRHHFGEKELNLLKRELQENQALSAKDEEEFFRKIFGAIHHIKNIFHGVGRIVHGIKGVKNALGEEELNLLKREVAKLQENQALSAKDEENFLSAIKNAFHKVKNVIHHVKGIFHGVATVIHHIKSIGEEELNLLKRELQENQALSAKDEELTGKIIRNFFRHHFGEKELNLLKRELQENQALSAKDEEEFFRKIFGAIHHIKNIFHGVGRIVHGIKGVKNALGEEELNLLKREVAKLQENQALSAKDEENFLSAIKNAFHKVKNVIHHVKGIFHGVATVIHHIKSIGEEELNLLKRELQENQALSAKDEEEFLGKFFRNFFRHGFNFHGFGEKELNLLKRELQENQALSAKDEEEFFRKIFGAIHHIKNIFHGVGRIVHGIKGVKNALGEEELNLLKREVAKLQENQALSAKDEENFLSAIKNAFHKVKNVIHHVKGIFHGVATVIHHIKSIGEEELNLLKRELQENQALSAKDEEEFFRRLLGAIHHGKNILNGVGTILHGLNGVRRVFGEEELNLLKREVAKLQENQALSAKDEEEFFGKIVSFFHKVKNVIHHVKGIVHGVATVIHHIKGIRGEEELNLLEREVHAMAEKVEALKRVA